ncbi:hypothetical protein CPB83DRAFT_602649 [Crepidotus variabilis]|uniref:Uncharacterized protein n=1 Tax=Crepidotus variabilis TaxID=179855 RepID=A0A9P6JKT8_9AGAR|nr:hypothetical protein CPB83DRAFT_602649 [Crepidotus variabilis]
MRFNFVLAISCLVTLAAGLVLPIAKPLSPGLEVREGSREEVTGIFARDSKKTPTHYKVPAGGDKPSQTYSHKQVKQAITAAKAAHSVLRSLEARPSGISKTARLKQPIQPFGNGNHRAPKKPGPYHQKSLPNMKGSGFEFALPNKHGAGKGPARIILQEKSNGKLKFKGVVAHDQSRAKGHPGYNDHFQVHPGFKKPKKH